MPIISPSGGSGGTALTIPFAEVLTNESTASATYVDLTTPGPSVTVTVGASGKVLVGYNVQASGSLIASVVLSGANTTAASDNWSEGLSLLGGRTYVFSSLTAGVTTFKMQYRSISGTSNALNRSIWALAL